ncbi:FtsW/RodA/SpoVE family cell cycle protein [candidate division WOR-3 bacterium]|nr:FtsW/RodA/SpoVE family cell cycle protein [candidate division WOR-3 bacterium]
MRSVNWHRPTTNGVLAASSFARESVERPNAPIDYALLAVVVTLTLLGVVMVYASTYHWGFHYLKWQLLRAIIGILALWVGTKLNIFRLASPGARRFLLILTVGALIATLFLGELVGVTKRNILGAFQPAEFAKFVVVIWLAGYFAELNASGKKPTFLNSLLKPGLVVGMIVMLTLMQPAVGTSFIIALSSGVLFVVAGVKWRYLLTAGLVVMLVIGAGLLMLPVLRNSKYQYIVERWDKFRAGDRYQQEQALIALGSGGLVGRGLGEGRQKYYFLPKLHKDFIFCAIGEEMGFLGCFGVMVLYLIFFLRSLRIAQRTTTEFGHLLGCGIGVVIILYAFVHQAVALSIIPTTGQPLPFISYGGSALMANLFAAGMVLKISKYRRSGIEEGVNRRGWNRWPYLSGARPRP